MSVMRSPRTPIVIGVGVVALATALSVGLALVGSVFVAVGAGLVALAAGLHLARLRPPVDEGRRRLLAALGVAGIGAVAGGPFVGRVVERLARSADAELLDAMGRSLGAGALESLRRGYHPGRSGELQLVLAPFNTSNYPHESKSLRPRDPRSSHALVWGYTDRIPLVVWGPGLVTPGDSDEPATLADLAPTSAFLMGSGFEAPDGGVLPHLRRPAEPPKVIVTLVIDGGGWNVLDAWPDAWPNLRRLMREGMSYRNAFMGSFPNVTASAHATIGTGAFPRTHGVPGHHVRYGDAVTPAWGGAGEVDPAYLLVPTLADVWAEETGGRAWIGELGYQVWHVGMIGAGGGGRPVGVYWDEAADRWASHNEDLYRLPEAVPPKEMLIDLMRRRLGESRARALLAEGGRALCCDPPIVRYQGALIEATLDAERVGRHEATDLLAINYKAPDYAGHTYNMLGRETGVALAAVDEEIGRLARSLARRFDPGEYVLIVTADHGQCPLIEDAGGVRLDTTAFQRDIEARFGRALRPLVENIRPSEVFLHAGALWEAGITTAEIATAFAGYRYRDNLEPYVPPDVIDRGRLEREQFAGVLSGDWIEGLGDAAVTRAGAGAYLEADPGVPAV